MNAEVEEDDLTPEERKELAGMQPSDENPDCKVGKCPSCGELRDDLLPAESGDLRCAECDTEYTYCNICEEEQHRDEHCRHIFETECGEWAGSGADSYDFAEAARLPFFALLGKMHPCFAGDLRAAILSGKFYTFAYMPMIGGGGSLEMHGMPDLAIPQGMDPYYRLFFWGNELMDLGCGEDAEELSDGYDWLASLYEGKTPDANRITVAWIEGWLAARTDRMICGFQCARPQ
jgi:hypothetical protein